MERVAIYCRLSKDDGDDAESNSVKTQKMILESYCKRQGWDVYDTYIDDGYSGTNFNRPGFQRMYQDVTEAKVNVVITKDLSRLGRNYILTGYYYQVFFPEAGVRFIAVNDHIDTKNENNDMAMAAFKNIMNDLHSKQLGKSVKAARRIRIESKYNCNSTAPYGYSFNSEHVLVPDLSVVPTIRFIYDEYINNPNSSRIARILNERGEPNRSSYQLNNKLYQSGKFSTKWTKWSPQEIITNPVYMGAIAIATRKKKSPYNRRYVWIPTYEQEIIYDCHEAIVPREIWEKANALYLQIWERHSGKKHPVKKLYSGKLFCAHCGNRLKINISSGIGYLTCSCWPPGRYRCVSTDVVARRFINEFRNIALKCESNEQGAYSYILDNLGSTRDISRLEIDIEINNAQKRINIINEKLSNFDIYTTTRPLLPKQRDAIFCALESSLKVEEKNLTKLRESDMIMPSGSEIEKFVHLARRFGYIEKIECSILEEIVDKIYITKKMNAKKPQQNRIAIKYKHVGVLTGLYKTKIY